MVSILTFQCLGPSAPLSPLQQTFDESVSYSTLALTVFLTELRFEGH